MFLRPCANLKKKAYSTFLNDKINLIIVTDYHSDIDSVLSPLKKTFCWELMGTNIKTTAMLHSGKPIFKAGVIRFTKKY